MSPIIELKKGLLKLNNHSYGSIDELMKKIMKKYNITAKELHYGFREKNNDKTPDEWIKERKKMKTFNEFITQVYSVIEEGRGSRGEDTKSSERLSGYMGKRAARNPKNTEKYWGGVLRLKERSPIGSKIIKSAKDSIAKEKTKLKTEDIEMSNVIYEMRKEDKVKGKKKTPKEVEVTQRVPGKVQKGDDGKWKVTKPSTHTTKRMSTSVHLGKFRHGEIGSGPGIQGGGHGGAGMGYRQHLHGVGGLHRGKKKREQPKRPETKLNTYQRKREVSRSKYLRQSGQAPSGYYSALVGDDAAEKIRQSAKKSFGAASKKWSEAEKSKPKKKTAKERMAAAAERLGLKD
jgi:hypothetical protein